MGCVEHSQCERISPSEVASEEGGSSSETRDGDEYYYTPPAISEEGSSGEADAFYCARIPGTEEGGDSPDRDGEDQDGGRHARQTQVATIRCGQTVETSISGSTDFRPYYLDLRSRSGNTAVNFNTCGSPINDPDMCVGTEYVDDSHTTDHIGSARSCHTRRTGVTRSFGENFTIVLPPGLQAVQLGSFSGSGVVRLVTNCVSTSAPAERLFDSGSQCYGSRSALTRPPTGRPTRPPTTRPPTLPPSAAPTTGFVCTPCIEPGSCDVAMAVDGSCPNVCPNPPQAEESAGLSEEEVVVVATTATTAAGCCAVFALVWFFCPKSCIATKVAKKARTMSMRKREGEDGPGSANAFENPIYGDGDGDFQGNSDEGGGFGDGYLEVEQDDE